MALVEMREGTSPHPDNDKVKLDERVISMSSTYYQCRGGEGCQLQGQSCGAGEHNGTGTRGGGRSQ